MIQRTRFIERLRLTLRTSVDTIIDSLYEPDFDKVKGMISSLKLDLEKIQNQIKSDE
jgi:hypothetical protein